MSLDAARRRLEAALAGGGPPALDDVRVVLAALDEAERQAAERWAAIGKLAPAAKAHRDRANTLATLALEAADALGSDPALAARLRDAAARS